MRYVGVDLGATNVRAVVADGEGTILGRARRRTPQESGVAVTEAVLSVVREACEAAGVAPGEVAAAGIASIGPLDLAEGAAVTPANIPVDRVPLTGPVGNLVDGPAHLLNDADAGVLGERFFGERTPDDLVYLTISTGIGAGVCVDGQVLSGWDGNAGEVGHVIVDPDGALRCGCGGYGHWEAYCSGANIPAYARHLHETEDVPTDLPVGDLDAAAVFEAADRDPLAERVLDRVGRWNAQGVADVVHAYAPLIVHVGGAVALGNPERVLDPIRERLPELVVSNVPEVRIASLGEKAVVRGALARAIQGT